MFKKAQKRESKLRIGITGPAGSGKSYGALLMAKGIAGETGSIAAIDTERGSLSLYADKFNFDVLELCPPFDPRRYVELIHEAEKAQYDVLIIDSITHEWIGEGGMLEMTENVPGANSFAKWKVTTPLHQKFIDAMLQSTCHIIVTMRSKTEYVEGEKNGKKTYVKAGTATQQRDGMDYEFTLILDVDNDKHIASASKDRTQLWENRFEKLTVKHGEELMAWLHVGAVPKSQAEIDAEIMARLKLEKIELQKMFTTKEEYQAWRGSFEADEKSVIGMTLLVEELKKLNVFEGE